MEGLTYRADIVSMRYSDMPAIHAVSFCIFFRRWCIWIATEYLVFCKE